MSRSPNRDGVPLVHRRASEGESHASKGERGPGFSTAELHRAVLDVVSAAARYEQGERPVKDTASDRLLGGVVQLERDYVDAWAKAWREQELAKLWIDLADLYAEFLGRESMNSGRLDSAIRRLFQDYDPIDKILEEAVIPKHEITEAGGAAAVAKVVIAKLFGLGTGGRVLSTWAKNCGLHAPKMKQGGKRKRNRPSDRIFVSLGPTLSPDSPNYAPKFIPPVASSQLGAVREFPWGPPTDEDLIAYLMSVLRARFPALAE